MNDSQARQIAWREQRHRRGTRAAAIMLGAKRGRSDAIQLVCLLNDRDPTIRQSAIRSLAQIGGASAVEAIARRVGDTDPSVRAAACRAAPHCPAGPQGRIMQVGGSPRPKSDGDGPAIPRQSNRPRAGRTMDRTPRQKNRPRLNCLDQSVPTAPIP